MNAKTLAKSLNISIFLLYHHWRMLRQREQRLQEPDPLPARGDLSPEQVDRLKQYILFRTRTPEKVK